jgi:4'-phosphopantetheinyl transferase EntD
MSRSQCGSTMQSKAILLPMVARHPLVHITARHTSSYVHQAAASSNPRESTMKQISSITRKNEFCQVKSVAGIAASISEPPDAPGQGQLHNR